MPDRGANAVATRNEKGQSTDSSHLFKVPDFPFLLFLIHFRFSSAHPLPVFLFFRFCLRARSHRPGEVVGVVSCSACLFRCLLLGGFVVRRLQRATESNTRSKDMEVFLVKTPGFLCIQRYRSHGALASVWLAAQLAPFRDQLLRGRFARGLQRATGSNTRSIDMMVFLVKTLGFLCM